MVLYFAENTLCGTDTPISRNSVTRW